MPLSGPFGRASIGRPRARPRSPRGQAYVFALLSAVYVAGATAHEEH